jgi:N-acetyl-anhydromuramyl-L-alanine amidase AmpD
MSLIGLVLSGVEIPLIRAKNAGPPRPGQRIDLIVIHTMEAPEKPGTARAVAHWFAGPDAPEASAHYCIDADETIQCVPEDVVAWAAPGANRRGIHLEHAGYASQTPAAWDDDYSRRVLARSAELAADIAARHQIPIVWLTLDQLAAGARGFCGHMDITSALNGGKGHTDPGAAFPVERYLELVRGPVTIA